jgi:hypothetical protein
MSLMITFGFASSIVPIACIGVAMLRHVMHAGAAEVSETVGSSSSSSELSPGGRSAEMINDSRSDADGKILVKRVHEKTGCQRPKRCDLGAGLAGSGSMHRKS